MSNNKLYAQTTSNSYHQQRNVTREKKTILMSIQYISGWPALTSACDQDNLPFVKFLVNNGADVNQATTNGWTAAHAAAKKGNVKTVQFLLEKGADVSLKASHREFGKNLEVKDVTTNQIILNLLEK